MKYFWKLAAWGVKQVRILYDTYRVRTIRREIAQSKASSRPKLVSKKESYYPRSASFRAVERHMHGSPRSDVRGVGRPHKLERILIRLSKRA